MSDFGGTSEHGGVPAQFGDGDPVVQTNAISHAGVPYVSWSGADNTAVEGIDPALVVGPEETVDEELAAALVGVDVQVHGIYNQPQPSVPDAAVLEAAVAEAEAAAEAEAEAVVQEETVSEETVEEVPVEAAPAPKRKPGRPPKNG